jgi:hypothetical protein
MQYIEKEIQEYYFRQARAQQSCSKSFITANDPYLIIIAPSKAPIHYPVRLAECRSTHFTLQCQLILAQQLWSIAY